MLRGRLYSAGMLKTGRVAAPVISIGNLSLGGTGKTPFVIYAAEVLLELGAVPALLSRGYGRVSPAQMHILPPGNEVPSPALNLGDEPALIRRRVPRMWLGVSTDRLASAAKILERRRDAVFLLDDGFQHRKIHRDLDIVLIDPTQPLASDHLFPGGTLREPLRALRRARAVVLNGVGTASAEDTVRRVHRSARIFHCTQRISAFQPFSSWLQRTPSAACRPGAAFLVAAIANPARFRADVEQLGIRVAGTRFFRDHTRISRREWERSADEALRSGAETVITTEKDAVKFPAGPELPVTVAVQTTSVVEHAEFAELLRSVLEMRRA
jgi:tetraacyldisaccharide 4'-kinase